VTVFGTRDFAPTDPFNPLPRAENVVGPGTAPQRVVALPHSHDTRRVVITVNGGEEIEIGRADGREPAVRLARDAIRMVEEAQAAQEWPEIGDRFLRPGAIVSIDVQRSDVA
jgi:hypothetical protein